MTVDDASGLSTSKPVNNGITSYSPKLPFNTIGTPVVAGRLT